jgi:hypothetical protein
MKSHHILSLKGISFIASMQYFGTLSQTSRVVLKKQKARKNTSDLIFLTSSKVKKTILLKFYFFT